MGRGNIASRESDAGSATDAATAYKHALKLCGEGAYGKALTLFDRAIAFRLDCPHYFAARANCKQATGQYVDAYHDYVSAIRLNRRKCTYFSCRGLCLVKMGKLDAALSDFSKACELEPTAAVYHYQKASLLHHRLARPGEAVLSYAECLAKVEPGDTTMVLRCLHAKGACLFEEGRAVEAVADLTRAVEMSDPSPASLHYLAKALKAVGREKRALAVLGEAIDKWEGGGGSCSDSGRHEAFFDRGVIRLQRGNDAGALSDFDQAVSLSGGAKGEYFVQRARAWARVAMRSNGREEAMDGVRDIEKAMELESSNSEFLFTAGVLCSRMGEYERALGHLQNLLKFFEERAAASRANTDGRGGGGEHLEAKGERNGSPSSPTPSARENKGGRSKDGKDAVASPAACEFEAALCLFKLGRSAEALRLAESALTTCCSLDAQRFQLRGLILHDLRRYAEAAKDFTASIAVRGQRPEGYLLRGRSLAGLSNHERAIRDFTTALALLGSKQNEDDLDGSRSREASSAAELQNNADAEGLGRDGDVAATTNQIEIDDSSNTNSYASHDRCAPSEPNTSGGADQNQQYLAKTGQQESLGEDDRFKLNGDGASRRRSQGADGGDGMAEGGSVVGACHYARALSLQQLGRHADAASDFDVAIAEGPISWQRLWHRAICLAELGEAFRPSAARDDLQACVSMAEKDEPPPERRNFLFQVGLAYYRLGESSTALECFDRARKEELRQLLQHDSSVEDPSLHYHRGLCLANADELNRAEDAFSLAIECRKRRGQRQISCAADSTDIGMEAAHHRERGKVRQLLRDFDGARSDFTACLAWSGQQTPATVGDNPGGTAGRAPGSSHDARTLFQRGWANKALGCLDQAAADFEAARRLEPLHPHLSVNYRNIFDTELVVIDDIEPLAQAPALFHIW